jgi:Protein of unknown function (DUF3987)
MLRREGERLAARDQLPVGPAPVPAELPELREVGGMTTSPEAIEQAARSWGIDPAEALAWREPSEDGEQSRDQPERDTGPASVREESRTADLSSPDPPAFVRGGPAAHEPTSPDSLSSPAPCWPTRDPAALDGLAGRVVEVLGPHTEADPAGVLLTFLVAFGNLIGSDAHAIADGADHPARLNVVLVGETSRSRKGTAWANVRRVLELAATDWYGQRVMGGLASGEGLIAAVRDPSDDDQGAADKRLLVIEPEFSRVLTAAGREGSTLSAVLRACWDDGRLRVMTRRDPLVATGAHVSVVGHITAEELVRSLTATEAANGFANRFLFCCVRRSKQLPDGGSLDPAALDHLADHVQHAAERARPIRLLHRSPAAAKLWEAAYRSFGDGPSGLAGALVARPEAQTLRLSVAYALLDRSNVIEVPHLEAALAVWRYCERSALHVFGATLGDPIADRLLAAVRQAGPAGLDRAGQYAAFARHVDRRQLERVRANLERRGLVITTTEQTRGRPRLVTRALRSN